VVLKQGARQEPALSIPALIYALVMNISALAQIALAYQGAGAEPADA